MRYGVNLDILEYDCMSFLKFHFKKLNYRLKTFSGKFSDSEICFIVSAFFLACYVIFASMRK